MARALVLTHSPTEGPGTLAEWLPAAGLELDVVAPWRGDPLPERVTEHAALVVLGGPQQAYDDGSAPWLRDTKALLAQAVSASLPTLGICLGAQLLAEAITAMEDSELVAETLGEHVFDFFLRNKRAEWQAYRSEVTPFELGRYLPVL